MAADVKIFATDIEEGAQAQVNELCALPPFEQAKVRVMPDAHAGAGCVIGLTANVTEAVIPNIVGVDIGCGLLAWELEAEASEELARALDAAAHSCVPVGMEVHDAEQIGKRELEEYACARDFKNRDRLTRSLGTLGGGNHFIECDVAPDGHAWLVVHSGSRNIGKQVADIYQARAIAEHRGNTDEQRMELIAHLKREGREVEISAALESLRSGASSDNVADDLCWLEGGGRDAYLHDMALAQTFAERNRARILEELLEGAGIKATGRMISSTHNYIDLEHRITRKGAIGAYEGERVIIPLNMAEGCVVGEGLGNDDWNCSAPHGAGRAMSRAAARRKLDLAEYERAMEGVYSTTVCEATIDEAPAAYKNAGAIVESLAPTVAVEFVMRPIWNFKAVEERVDWKERRLAKKGRGARTGSST